MGNPIMQRADGIAQQVACVMCEALEQTAKLKCPSSNCDSMYVLACGA